MSTTQFVWRDCLGMRAWEPPEPKSKKKERFGPDAECWLCGGGTNGAGWHFKDVIGTAFTDFNIAAAPHSSTVCQSCAALMKKEAWVEACAAHDHDPNFPVKDGKKPFLANWMFSSHVFSADEWLRPDRSGVRDVLLNPPKPPFVMTLASVGKKHVIFRARVNASREQFSVNLDDTEVLVVRETFARLLSDFEQAYEAGFSKDSLLTGHYNQAAILALGLSQWREIERKMRMWRTSEPGMLQLAHFAGQKSKK